MRIPDRGRSRALRFNITPMIDVVFNLIIFFLAASHFARSESVESVQLPVAGTGRPDQPDTLRRMVITVPADETLHVGGSAFQLAQIEQLLLAEAKTDPQKMKNFEVRIRTDRTVPYRTIEPILLACARAGVSKVKFAVLPAD